MEGKGGREWSDLGGEISTVRIITQNGSLGSRLAVAQEQKGIQSSCLQLNTIPCVQNERFVFS